MKPGLKSFLWLLFFKSYCLMSQNPFAIKIDKTKGLASNDVYDVLQTDNGLIWYASSEGLSSFDGKFHKNYYCSEQTSLAGSNLKKDIYGRVWYENFDGYLYYVQNDTLKNLTQNQPITYIPFGISNQFLFVIQKNGIDIFDLKTLKIIKTIDVETLEIQSATSDQNNFYFFKKGVLCKIDAQLQLTQNSNFVNNFITNVILETHNDIIYILPQTKSSLIIYTFNNQLEPLFEQSLNQIDFINSIDILDQNLWIHTVKGSYVYGLEHNKLNFKQVYFKDNSISRVIKDYQNNYWFSNLNQGLLLVNNLLSKEYDISELKAHKMTMSNSGLLLATLNGKLLLKKDKEILNLLDKPLLKNVYYLFQDPENQNLFYSHFGFSVAPKGNLNNSINFNSALKKVIKIDEKYYAMAMSGYVSLYLSPNSQTSTKSVWDTYFKQHQDTLDASFALIENKIRSKTLAYNPITQTLIYASNRGLVAVNPNFKKEITYNQSVFYAKEIEYANAAFYVLSTKGNLYELNENNQFVLLNKTLNIPENAIKNVKKQNDKLYIVTHDYFYEYDIKTKGSKILNVNIHPNDVLDFDVKNNVFYALNKEQLLEFDLARSVSKHSDLKFRINAFKVGNQFFNINQTVDLKYTQNSVNIQYAILDFGNTIPNQLYYQLNNDDWIAISTESREIQFNKLSPGNYTLNFKLNNQVLSQKIKFKIATPFWKTIWFILLSIGLVFGMVYFYYQWRVKMISRDFKLKKDKLQLEKDLSKSVLTSIKSQMNPHFFYNALNTIQSYLFTNDKRNAINYLSKFSKLTRMILEMSENESIKLNEELEALKLYLELEKMRFEDDFNYQIEMSNAVDLEMVKIPSMLIQPYVENAVKHGLLHKEGQKSLVLKFDKEQLFLKVVIQDNGVGRKKSEELNVIKESKHTSYATKANLKRLEILNQDFKNSKPIEIEDLYDENQLALGTKVTLYIPIS